MGNRASHAGGGPPPPPLPYGQPGGYMQDAFSQTINDERTYGRAPPEPLFPWQFFADKNAAKLDQVRQRRHEAAAKRREEALAKRNGFDTEAEIEEGESKASVAPEDGSCCFDMIPREILLYILQDVGEETLATACPFVNRQFYEASLDDQLWRHLFMVDIGRAPPSFHPSYKYSNGKWHRQPATEKEEYFYKIWKWYESYGRSVRDVREERFTELMKGWMEVSPYATARMDLFSEITSFDRRKLRRVQTNDRSAPSIHRFAPAQPPHYGATRYL